MAKEHLLSIVYRVVVVVLLASLVYIESRQLRELRAAAYSLDRGTLAVEVQNNPYNPVPVVAGRSN